MLSQLHLKLLKLCLQRSHCQSELHLALRHLCHALLQNSNLRIDAHVPLVHAVGARHLAHVCHLCVLVRVGQLRHLRLLLCNSSLRSAAVALDSRREICVLAHEALPVAVNPFLRRASVRIHLRFAVLRDRCGRRHRGLQHRSACNLLLRRFGHGASVARCAVGKVDVGARETPPVAVLALNRALMHYGDRDVRVGSSNGCSLCSLGQLVV
mmetsp:Transcript_44886/g.93562  ORF Transcript_44886/g.93562 Transcript_44886/m.93562 type:complete len:211 (+) Transcript_44886:365-997(+)